MTIFCPRKRKARLVVFVLPIMARQFTESFVDSEIFLRLSGSRPDKVKFNFIGTFYLKRYITNTA